MYIGRPSGWGNPFVIGRDGDREQVCRKYDYYLRDCLGDGTLLMQDLAQLHGKDLVCHCAPMQCHGENLERAALWAHERLKRIRYHSDIFTCDADYIVNPVNTEGHSGKGLALAFRHKFPDNYAAYRAKCRSGFSTGQIFIHNSIINFPTKELWRNPSKYSYIENGLKTLNTEIRPPHSIAFPYIGAGLGGLSCDKVFSLIAFHVDASVIMCGGR